jgi:hypothetical protein
LFILTDDQSPETLSSYGNKVCQTPNIDRLAAEGMVFHDAHHMGAWVGAVCTPSRTMIMTGRTVWRVPGARGPGIDLPKEFRQQAAEQSMPATNQINLADVPEYSAKRKELEQLLKSEMQRLGDPYQLRAQSETAAAKD